MLRALDIRDLLIIDRLSLALQPGLNVLTGETGAGKSILLDALGFVLGWRTRADLVRAGADQGEVTAEFDLPPLHAAHAVLAE
ncbi:MAG TPA: AAA family ATPase, partial [Paracoccaceae bacterium]|nr:AAA family ATPase [Paracoccaceae bacterium]